MPAAELQARLQSCDFVVDVRRPFEVERAAAIVTLDQIRKHGLGYLIHLTNQSRHHRLMCALRIGWRVSSDQRLAVSGANQCVSRYQTLLNGTIDSSQRAYFLTGPKPIP